MEEYIKEKEQCRKYDIILNRVFAKVTTCVCVSVC